MQMRQTGLRIHIRAPVPPNFCCFSYFLGLQQDLAELLPGQLPDDAFHLQVKEG
jgi:hypothetical protein